MYAPHIDAKSPPVSGTILLILASIAIALVLTASTSFLANLVFDLVGFR